MVLGTLVRFRLAWAAAQNLPGTVLRQRPSAEGCLIDGASHFAIPLLFVSARESQRQAGVLRLNSTCRAPPEPVDRPSQPASPHGPYLRGCSRVGQNYSSESALGKDSRFNAMFVHALQPGSYPRRGQTFEQWDHSIVLVLWWLLRQR